MNPQQHPASQPTTAPTVLDPHVQAAADVGVEGEDLDHGQLAKVIGVVVVSVVVLATIATVLTVGRINTMDVRAEAVATYPELAESQRSAQELLGGYAVASAEAQTYRVPIDRAMQLVALTYAQRQQGLDVQPAPENFNLYGTEPTSAVQIDLDPVPPTSVAPVVPPAVEGALGAETEAPSNAHGGE